MLWLQERAPCWRTLLASLQLSAQTVETQKNGNFEEDEKTDYSRFHCQRVSPSMTLCWSAMDMVLLDSSLTMCIITSTTHRTVSSGVRLRILCCSDSCGVGSYGEFEMFGVLPPTVVQEAPQQRFSPHPHISHTECLCLNIAARHHQEALNQFNKWKPAIMDPKELRDSSELGRLWADTNFVLTALSSQTERLLSSLCGPIELGYRKIVDGNSVFDWHVGFP